MNGQRCLKKAKTRGIHSLNLINCVSKRRLDGCSHRCLPRGGAVPLFKNDGSNFQTEKSHSFYIHDRKYHACYRLCQRRTLPYSLVQLYVIIWSFLFLFVPFYRIAPVMFPPQLAQVEALSAATHHFLPDILREKTRNLSERKPI